MKREKEKNERKRWRRDLSYTRLKEGDRESVSDWCGLGTDHFHLEKFWLWWEIITVLIKKRGGNIAQSINGRVLNVWVNGSSEFS